MLTKRTVIVIGAGASAELGMPVGGQLAKMISETLNPNAHTDIANQFSARIINNAWHEMHQYRIAAKQISEGISFHGSIDQYIDNHSHDEYISKCGKAAIAFSILTAERNSKLFADIEIGEPIDLSKAVDTWYEKFAKILITKTSYSKRAEIFKNVTVVSFNCDRCLDLYLLCTLIKAYKIELSEAEEILKSLDIIYLYGNVGRITNSEKIIIFGQRIELTNIVEISRSIRTYTEQADDERMLDHLHDKIAMAQKLVFLGFSFHEQNVRLLTPKNRTQIEKIFATTHGCSASDREVIEQLLNNAFLDQSSAPVATKFADQTCNQFFTDHSRILTY